MPTQVFKRVAMLGEYQWFFFQAEDGIRDLTVTGVQTCALPISRRNSSCAGRQARGALSQASHCYRTLESAEGWGETPSSTHRQCFFTYAEQRQTKFQASETLTQAFTGYFESIEKGRTLRSISQSSLQTGSKHCRKAACWPGEWWPEGSVDEISPSPTVYANLRAVCANVEERPFRAALGRMKMGFSPGAGRLRGRVQGAALSLTP